MDTTTPFPKMCRRLCAIAGALFRVDGCDHREKPGIDMSVFDDQFK